MLQKLGPPLKIKQIKKSFENRSIEMKRFLRRGARGLNIRKEFFNQCSTVALKTYSDKITMKILFAKCCLETTEGKRQRQVNVGVLIRISCTFFSELPGTWPDLPDYFAVHLWPCVKKKKVDVFLHA